MKMKNAKCKVQSAKCKVQNEKLQRHFASESFLSLPPDNTVGFAFFILHLEICISQSLPSMGLVLSNCLL